MACTACLYAQSQILVDKSATGLNNGQTWDNAYTDLQTALQNAVSGDEIWVASGTYYPTSGVNRNFSFEPPSGIKLLGGFKGTESAPEQRNWQINPTILSGDIGVEGDSTDNSFCVVFLHEPDTNTIIDGFIIKDGVADNTAAPSFARGRCGGGMYIMGYDAEAYPDIQNCTFLHNTALQNGAGAMAFGAGMGSVAPRFINCRFESNHAVTGNGEGMLVLVEAGWNGAMIWRVVCFIATGRAFRAEGSIIRTLSEVMIWTFMGVCLKKMKQ